MAFLMIFNILRISVKMGGWEGVSAGVYDIFPCPYDIELSLKCLGKTVWTTVPPKLNTETETLNFPVSKINQL